MMDQKYDKDDLELFSHKYISDPIYGSIGLSKLEADLINTAAFQRLRHLKQLGFASYVFPGGEHSRFVHSLGVLYIMGRMCAQLETNHNGSTSDSEPLFTRNDTIKLRVAALLHDIGHYPLSHLGEKVFCFEAEQLANMGSQDQVYDTISEMDAKSNANKNLDPLLFKMSKIRDKSAHHEKLGVIVVNNNKEIRSILESAGLKPSEICAIFSRDALPPKNTLYHNMLHSNLDADRLDYLLRDSTQTGVKFGLVDLDYLIRLMIVKRVSFEDGTARIILYNKKGQNVIEHFLMCRYFHYAQVVTHRTSSAFEALAKVVFYKLLKEKAFLVSSSTDLFKPNAEGQWFVDSPEFLKFTDDEWWHSASVLFESTGDSTYRLFFESLLRRIPPRSVYFSRDINSYCRRLPLKTDLKEQLFVRKRIIENRLPTIAKQLGLDPERLGCSFGESDIEKDSYKVSSEIIDNLDEEAIDCIKLFDCVSDKISFLSKDDTSMVAQIADLYSESVNLFYVPYKDEKFDESAISAKIREMISAF